MGIASPRTTIYAEVGKAETHWKTQRDRWRTAAWTAIMALALLALVASSL